MQTYKKCVIHFYEDQEMMKLRLKSGGDFRGGPLCGNGSAHAKTTHLVSKVTCKLCLDTIAQNNQYWGKK